MDLWEKRGRGGGGRRMSYYKEGKLTSSRNSKYVTLTGID